MAYSIYSIRDFRGEDRRYLPIFYPAAETIVCSLHRNDTNAIDPPVYHAYPASSRFAEIDDSMLLEWAAIGDRYFD